MRQYLEEAEKNNQKYIGRLKKNAMGETILLHMICLHMAQQSFDFNTQEKHRQFATYKEQKVVENKQNSNLQKYNVDKKRQMRYNQAKFQMLTMNQMKRINVFKYSKNKSKAVF